MKTLLQGGLVVAPTRADLLAGGDVLVDGETIAGLGARGEFASTPVDRTLDVSDCLVLPGLVNTHQHEWYLLGKGLGDDRLLEKWIWECLFPLKAQLTPDDFRVASELAALDMIRGGTTTCVNHLVAETSAGEEEAILQPVAASGMRQFFAKAVRPGDVKDDFESARSCFETWDGAADGRIRVGLVLEATSHWVAAGQTTEEMLIGGHGLAAELNTFITAHIAGGTMSREDGYLKYVLETGRTDIEFLHRLGILDRRWILAHTINTRERDLALIAESGATVSHTPSSEAARGGGVTPVREMLRRGIRVALGTDGPMVDHTNDMLEQLKWTRLLQNQVHHIPSSIAVDTLVAMGTSYGAEALDASGIFGTLAPGLRADIAMFDINTLHAAVTHNPLSTLVHAVRSSDARHVMVDGELLLHDGQFTRADRMQVTDLINRAGKAARALGRRAGLL
ncbi:amidohydrolase family protein [Wenjunlia tyrosinilytica]|uniref:Ethylammeline chlorohydrolase n=1 Tax=Wenjunlia tyrosinilytica TaxID=1544741 RepID=A0A917ZZK2_9ACTN|nr:amidohydrolase family protein [Wenjunlia tyrosinilytica]GGP00483.1 ethylammeline chlorohydrolase [Wenjunlia tyrosinilytica]